MKLSGFLEMFETDDERVGTGLLLILNKLNKTTVVDVDASLR